MDQNEAFLQEIRENFHNDTPRLVYADWLEEHATTAAQLAIAEFIRVQIELAGIPEVCDRTLLTRWRHLHRRENALLQLHQMEWLRRGEFGDFPPGEVKFRRGFASEGRFLLKDLQAGAAAVLSHPFLRTVSVSGIDDQSLPELLVCPWLSALRGLTLQPGSCDWPEGRPVPTNWERLANADCFDELNSLCLWGEGVLTRSGAARLAANPMLAGVCDLQVLVPLRTQPVPDLLGGRAFESLKSLNLQAYEPPGTPPPDIFENANLSDVEQLTLRGYYWDEPSVERLVHAPFWNGVREVTLGEGGMTADALCALGSASSATLKSLALIQNLPMDLSGLCGPILRTVRSLHLITGMSIDPAFVGQLANCEHAVEIRSLGLQSRTVGDAEIAVLAASPRFNSLYRLDLMHSGVTSIGAMALATSPYMENIASLCLFACELDDPAKAALRDRFGESVWH